MPTAMTRKHALLFFFAMVFLSAALPAAADTTPVTVRYLKAAISALRW